MQKRGIKFPAEFDVGGIIGNVTIADCVAAHRSPWFRGPYGWVLKDAHPVRFKAMKGKVGLFHS